MKMGTWRLVFYRPTRTQDRLGAPVIGRGEAREGWAVRLGDGAATIQQSETPGIRTIYAETRWVINKWGFEDISAEWTFDDSDGNEYDIVAVQDRKGAEHDQFLIRAVRRDTQRTLTA